MERYEVYKCWHPETTFERNWKKTTLFPLLYITMPNLWAEWIALIR